MRLRLSEVRLKGSAELDMAPMRNEKDVPKDTRPGVVCFTLLIAPCPNKY